jgi:hypothetical protein
MHACAIVYVLVQKCMRKCVDVRTTYAMNEDIYIHIYWFILLLLLLFK